MTKELVDYCVYISQLALRQTFFTTERLTRLVLECKENVELLFPLEAEVVESTSTRSSDATTLPLSTGEGTSDVSRRTVDAIRTIKGLKKESSTSNPLSFASIFGNQDIDTGAITAEDSPFDSQSEPPDCDHGHTTE